LVSQKAGVRHLGQQGVAIAGVSLLLEQDFKRAAGSISRFDFAGLYE